MKPQDDTMHHNNVDGIALGKFITARRIEHGISRRELARRANVADLSRIEAGLINNPSTGTLWAIAQALDITPTELIAAGRPTALPAFRPYLRTKYGQLPERDLAEMERYFANLAAKHGLTDHDIQGPSPGDDE